MINLAINGFGRIGRAALKVALEHPDEIKIVAINDLGDISNLAYLLRYDTVYGRYQEEVKVEKDKLIVGDHKIKVLSEPEPANLPWSELEVAVVIESTGIFTKEEDARQHLEAGAKKVVISAPTKSQGVTTAVLGVNDQEVAGQEIISNASCTTNCATPVMAVLDNFFGVAKAVLTTVHAYTATQELVDGPAKKDPRRGRAAAQNIVPSSTGAALAAAQAYQPLTGKFDGVSVRVPVPIVSLGDFSVLLQQKVRVEEVNQAFIEAVDNPIYRGVIAVTDEANVSSDFIKDPHSAIIDLNMTRVVDDDLVKVMAWYDNEWGYSNRLVEQVIEIG